MVNAAQLTRRRHRYPNMIPAHPVKYAAPSLCWGTALARFALALLCALAGASSTWAKQGALDAWVRQYGPVSESGNNAPGCGGLCHYDPSTTTPKLNAYGAAIRTEFKKFVAYPNLQDPERDMAIRAVELYPADNDLTSASHLDPSRPTFLEYIFWHYQPGWSPGPINTIYKGHNTDPVEPTADGQQPPIAGIKGNLDPLAGPLRCHRGSRGRHARLRDRIILAPVGATIRTVNSVTVQRPLARLPPTYSTLPT